MILNGKKIKGLGHFFAVWTVLAVTLTISLPPNIIFAQSIEETTEEIVEVIATEEVVEDVVIEDIVIEEVVSEEVTETVTEVVIEEIDEEIVSGEVTNEVSSSQQFQDEFVLSCSPSSSTVQVGEEASFGVTALIGSQDRFYVWSAPGGSPSEQSGQNLNVFNTTFSTPGAYVVTVFSAEFGNDPASCHVTVVPTNTAPAIILIGANPLNISMGSTFVDPGATATDTEDGNLTSQIVATGTVNTSVAGAYTRTYSVTDSGGLSASTTRTVNVAVSGGGGGNPNLCTLGTNGELSAHQFDAARSARKIRFTLNLNTASSTAVAKLFNDTNCTFPLSLTVHKMFDQKLSTQVLFDSTGLVMANASGTSALTELEVDLPSCMAQIDFWFGLGPEVLDDTNPYGWPNVPHVLAFKFIHNTGQSYFDASGQFCTTAATNTPPVITLIGGNPLNISMGSTFVDPGATATDTEDGNLTSQIVATGTVNTSVAGAYTRTYSVTDSGGLSASTTRTVNVAVSGGGGGGGTTTPQANLTVTKVADKSTASVGENISYTINLINNGTATATNVSINDTLPSGLDFLSASTTVGNYSTSTSLWTIGTLNPASSTSLTIIATVKSGTEGQKITNTAVATSTESDSNPSDNTSGAETTVNTPSGGGGGGGGGAGGGAGGGGSSGTGGRRHDISNLLATGGGQVLGVTSCFYLRDFLHRNWQNDPIEVLKLQSFLNVFEKENLSYSGFFDQPTFEAVSRFQNKYFNDILEPWGHTAPTGFVYILTKKKINEIYCSTVYPLSATEQQEINDFRNYLEELKSGGMFVPDVSGTVGVDTFGTGTTVTDRNGILSNDVIRNAAISLFALPENLSEAIKCAAIFLIILAAIYVLSSLLAGSGARNAVERNNIRRRKHISMAVGILLAITIASLIPYFCTVLPLVVAFLVVLAMLIFGNYTNGKVAVVHVQEQKKIEPTVPMITYDKSLEEMVPSAGEETPVTPTESEKKAPPPTGSGQGFKGILDKSNV